MRAANAAIAIRTRAGRARNAYRMAATAISPASGPISGVGEPSSPVTSFFGRSVTRMRKVRAAMNDGWPRARGGTARGADAEGEVGEEGGGAEGARGDGGREEGDGRRDPGAGGEPRAAVPAVGP